MLVQIDSWWGGGKSVLTGLLDGHPELFTFLYHDASYMPLMIENNNEEWVVTKHTEQLRRILGHWTSNYYAIERMANQGFQIYDFSSTERVNLKYPVDFYQFDSSFFKELISLPDWTLEKIIHVLYKNLFMELTKVKKTDTLPKYFLSQSFPILNHQKNFFNVYPSAKSILVKRNVANLIATRSNRKIVEDDYQSKTIYSSNFNKVVKERNEVENILAYYDFWEEMAGKFPDKVLIVHLDDLNMNTEKTMRKVAGFLGIKFDKILLKWTYLGEEIKVNGESYIGKERDDATQLLSAKEIKIIDKKIKSYHRKKNDQKRFKNLRISPSVFFVSKIIRHTGKRIEKYGL